MVGVCTLVASVLTCHSLFREAQKMRLKFGKLFLHSFSFLHLCSWHLWLIGNFLLANGEDTV